MRISPIEENIFSFKADIHSRRQFKPNAYLSKCTSTGGFVTFFVKCVLSPRYRYSV